MVLYCDGLPGTLAPPALTFANVHVRICTCFSFQERRRQHVQQYPRTIDKLSCIFRAKIQRRLKLLQTPKTKRSSYEQAALKVRPNSAAHAHMWPLYPSSLCRWALGKGTRRWNRCSTGGLSHHATHDRRPHRRLVNRKIYVENAPAKGDNVTAVHRHPTP